MGTKIKMIKYVTTLILQSFCLRRSLVFLGPVPEGSVKVVSGGPVACSECVVDLLGEADVGCLQVGSHFSWKRKWF